MKKKELLSGQFASDGEITGQRQFISQSFRINKETTWAYIKLNKLYYLLIHLCLVLWVPTLRSVVTET